MNSFQCPKCKMNNDISELEMWDLYEDNKETEFDCPNCDSNMIITSIAEEWSFETEINE